MNRLIPDANKVIEEQMFSEHESELQDDEYAQAISLLTDYYHPSFSCHQISTAIDDNQQRLFSEPILNGTHTQLHRIPWVR